VAAAHQAACTHLLTEDLQDGQDLDGLLVINPFMHDPASVLPE
jgi:predicted nucleic acid-binding protein